MFVKWIELNCINRESRARGLEVSMLAVLAHLDGALEHSRAPHRPSGTGTGHLPHQNARCAPHPSARPALRPAPETGAEEPQPPGLHGKGRGRGVGGRHGRFPSGTWRGPGLMLWGGVGGRGERRRFSLRSEVPQGQSGECGGDCPQGQVVGKGTVDGKFQKGSTGQGQPGAWRVESGLSQCPLQGAEAEAGKSRGPASSHVGEDELS